MNRSLRLVLRAGTAAAVAALTLAGGPAGAATSTPLVGTFRLQAGSCAGGVTGSYFRMISPGGSTNGPFFSNNSSSCSTKTYTLLTPGTDGGLVTGGYQPRPNPAFDGSGNGLADRIAKPTPFFGNDFAVSTNPVDPQTGSKVTAPTVTLRGTTLSADLRAVNADWNGQQFNQGSPKPDGSTTGNTRAASGTYDPATGAFTLQWTSQIQGGAFSNFTGLWHLAGRFVPAAHPATTGTGGTTGGTTGAGTTGSTTTAAVTPGPSATAGATPTALAPTRGATPTATASASPAATAPGSDAPSDATSSGQGPTDLASQHKSGAPAWPWAVVAAVLVVGAGGLVLRLRARS